MKKHLLFSACLFLGAQHINAQDVTNGLVSKYTFDNQDVTDEIGSNDGSTSANPMYVMGYGNTGSAIRFNGYDPSSPIAVVDKASISSGIINFDQPFTISFWFRVDAFNPVSVRNLLSSRKDVLGAEAGGIEFTIESSPDNRVRVFGRTTNPLAFAFVLNTAEIENLGTWYHLALTQSGSGDLILYLNGTLASITSPNNPAEQNNYWTIGSDAHPGGTASAREFDGLIDELRFYDRELSAAEVTQLYNYTPMTVSIDEAEANSGIRVYPNPATDVLNFTGKERSEYTLLDISGKTIMTGFVNPGQTLDVSNLVDGMYVVEVRNGDQLNRFKVLKK